MFFFDQYYEVLRNDPRNHYFFNPPEPSKATESEREAYQKAKAENAKAWSRVGWWGVYKRLLDGGFFNEPNKTPSESVLSMDFATAVRQISIENAL